MKNLESILLPAIADTFAIDRLDNPEGETLRRIAFGATTSSARAAFEELSRRYARDPKGLTIRQALRSGQAELYPEVTLDTYERVASDAEEAALIRQIGVRSSIVLPLVVRNRTFGVLSMGMSESGRTYTAEDIPFGQELARRIAQAIDNARLYERAHMNAETLRQQVEERTHALQQALERANAADQAKTTMLSNVTHEMRTPISSIVGFSNLLMKRALAEAKQQEFIAAINLEGRRLHRLIDNFLDLQRIGSGHQTFSFVPVDLMALLQEELDHIGLDKISLPPIRIDGDTVPPVSADIEALRRVIRNLISNALKFCPDGEIVVSLRVRDSNAQISIRDHGIGIPPEELAHLFERFYRGTAAESRRNQGTGLGLALCREIIEAHRGRIWAESAGEGQGATFHFTLPVKL